MSADPSPRTESGRTICASTKGKARETAMIALLKPSRTGLSDICACQ